MPGTTPNSVEAIGRAASAHRGPVVVVAVDGHSAAGKSTFAARLVSRFDAALISGDDFYRVMDPVERAMLDPEQGVRRYYDWQRMSAEAIGPLRGGHAARYHPYDWQRNLLAEQAVTIEPRPIVVVEGLFVSRPELADLVDVAAVVVADPAVRLQRQHDRADAHDDWLDRWDAAERWYFEHVRGMDTFEVIVNDTATTGT